MSEIKEGDLIDVTIDFVGKKGDGVAKVEDYVVFVPNAKEGENLGVKVIKVLNKVAFCETNNK